jgi:isocitrate dehydrogenase
MSTDVPITAAHGDGIGPEMTEASVHMIASLHMISALHIIPEAGARIDLEVYKAPITTPRDGGNKSLNVTARKMLGLLGNTLGSYNGAAGYTLSQGQ